MAISQSHFKYTNSEKLSTIPILNGNIIFVKDSAEIYADFGKTRIRVGVGNASTNNIASNEDIRQMILESNSASETCAVCLAITNTAKTSDIELMLADNNGIATGDAITNDKGCHVETTSSDDISTLINNPDELNPNTDKNTYFRTDCIAQVVNISESKKNN